jgi:signal transduction histidine kinase
MLCATRRQGGKISIRRRTIQARGYAIRSTHYSSRLWFEGIPPENLPFIFDRFWRGDKSRSGRTHSGLGLAIAKQLIHAHDGTIEAQSELGTGTSFIIELPNG